MESTRCFKAEGSALSLYTCIQIKYRGHHGSACARLCVCVFVVVVGVGVREREAERELHFLPCWHRQGRPVHVF